jgi:glycosyltransferase involved in cell wall biosynthesis
MVVCVSRDEAAFFASHGARTVQVRTPWLRHASLTSPSLRERADIGFVAGWLGGVWSPNGDGLAWFASQVLPRITAVVPWARLRVTGTLPPELRPFEGPNLTSTGFVDDLAMFYRGLRVAVAPIRYGAGVKLKTVEAVQYGVPIVATPVGAEGLEELHGEAIAVHEAADAFAAAVIARLVDVAVWRRHRAAIEAALGRVPPEADWKTLLASGSEGDAIVRHAI